MNCFFIPQLEKAREATDAANLRATYAEVVAEYLSTGKTVAAKTVDANQKQAGWTDTEIANSLKKVFGQDVAAKTSGSWSISCDDTGAITIS